MSHIIEGEIIFDENRSILLEINKLSWYDNMKTEMH